MMPTDTEIANFEAERSKIRSAGFKHWKEQPVTASILDAFEADSPDDEEMFERLLEDAYNTGFACGGVYALTSMLTKATEGMSRPRRAH